MKISIYKEYCDEDALVSCKILEGKLLFAFSSIKTYKFTKETN
jgi:hypothetical protein